jgi:two-component system OmpR family response regulator
MLDAPGFRETVHPQMDIVLVEDEPKLAEQVSRALQRAGHRVRSAPDGPSGLAEVTGARCDLVVLDVNLPGFDGIELLTRIRALALPVRVLMLTARSEVGDRVTG